MRKLKSIILSAAVAMVALAANAQDAPETTEFEVEGIKVILRQSVKGTVSARLFVQGGVTNYAKAKDGVENLALSLAMTSGPASMEKQAFNEATEAVGASMGASSSYDYGNLSLNCVKLYWDKSWDLFAMTVANPAWREDDFAILKEQAITGSKQSKSSPDARLSEMAMTKAWAGTDYEKIPSGDEESLGALTLEDLKEHYAKVVTKKNIFLVVVGDITEADLKAKVKKAWAKLPEGTAPKEMYVGTPISEGLYVEDRDIETNYIKGQFDAPQKGTEESVQNSLAYSIMRNRFFEELRTKRSLSYAPSARSTGYTAYPMNEIYISTTDPKASLEVMVDELNKVRKDGFTEKELEGKKQSYITGYFMGQESNSSIAMSLGISEMTGGWEQMDKFTDRVLNTTLTDINNVVQNYGDKIYWSYLGKEELVKPEYFTQPAKTEKMKK